MEWDKDVDIIDVDGSSNNRLNITIWFSSQVPADAYPIIFSRMYFTDGKLQCNNLKKWCQSYTDIIP